MTRIDLHPEDLLERAARGQATAAELTRLEQHLADCAVCRVEQALMARAASDSAPLRDEELLVARLKRNVGERLRTPAHARPRRRRSSVVALVATLALAASAAAAATVVVIRRAESPPEVRQPARSRAAPEPRAAQATPSEPAVTASAAPTPAAVPPPVTGPTAKPAATEALSASELFSRANQARRDGKAKEAVRLYRSLQERFAGSSEELVSRVTLGRLLLDRLGDSRGALVQFNSYLASPGGGGALREEAMVGRALALGRLGRVAEERAAWRAVLDAFPRSAHEKRAKARLEELEAPRSGTR